MRVALTLEAVAADAIRRALDVEAPPVLRPTSDERHGDYQINAALGLAKQLKKQPRELGTRIAEALGDHPAFANVEVAGPGFVNLRLSPAWVGERLAEDLRDPNLGVPRAATLERVVVDYSAPNVAKQMHVGHIRSTILGAAMVQLLRFVGHEVIGDNHVGDWGTQFGLLIVGMRRFGDEAALDRDPIAELDRVYKLANQEAKSDDAFAASARAELAKLQAGDAANKALWERFVAATRVTLDTIYQRLGVSFETWLGESAYDAMLPDVVKLLSERGIARRDEGALCVFFDDRPDLGKSPFIVQKRDGAFLYATTDIATLLYRKDELSAQRCIYVVDSRQSLHFKQLFAVADKLELGLRLEHMGFGSVLGTDGKPLKARDGQPITLASLLDEAEERALARMRQRPDLDLGGADEQAVASAVGIGAVKYADLRQNRLSDYQFDWDKMVSFEGNAGPYLQYAAARCGAIFRKGGIDPDAIDSAVVALDAPEELALGKRLLGFADVVHEAAESCYPHLLCDHLYALARSFSSFYEACPVLKSEGRVRDSRLALCALSARQLKKSLELLGLTVIDRM
jgi:arginyl-tRNA synthetase